jgi:DNA-binding NarL/FixJ family response regulator
MAGGSRGASRCPSGESQLTLGPVGADKNGGRAGSPPTTMNMHSPMTVAITRFEDLLALGLQTALEADPSISVVARDVLPSRIGTTLRVHRPRVLVLDVDALRDYSQVRELRIEHPETRLVLLGHGLSSIESAQLLAFGASACLTTGTQVRDLRHAIHLASRGLQLQLLPTSPDTQVREPLLTPREGDVLVLLGRTAPTRRSRLLWASASKPSAHTPAASIASSACPHVERSSRLHERRPLRPLRHLRPNRPASGRDDASPPGRSCAARSVGDPGARRVPPRWH